mmetsp:Transcript_17825/g.36223  ORF Transcript_17825/g.36223 Transcript_17825/m.36223 type:complete len:340 (+) Transcript_17825:266-1285(+)
MPQSGGSPIVRRPHLFWIDVVRFFAVVSVMCGHWSDTVQRINGSDRFEDLMEKDAEMRLRRARSVGSQWTLPLLFYVSGLVHGFSVKKTTFPQYLLTRSWRLLLPLIVGWVLYVYPLLWLFRDFYYEAEVLKEASNFFTGLSQIPKLILRPGPMYLWFLIAIWVMGFINHLYFRCVALVTADLDRGDGNKSLWRFGVGMSLVLVFLSSAVIQYKVIDPGRQDKEVGLVLSLYLFAVPYVSAFGVALWYCQKKGQPVPGWLGPLIVAQQVALGTWHGGVAFHLSDVEMHKPTADALSPFELGHCLRTKRSANPAGLKKTTVTKDKDKHRVRSRSGTRRHK